ncbi:Sigma-54-dependent Fis family transcriptional regulator [Candidatus Magnetomoraceae bacterium gMMP-15]
MNPSLYPSFPIMVVDDENIILSCIEQSLVRAGLNNIITCQDSKLVVEMLESSQVETILMDLGMLHHNGKDLLTMISTKYPEIPVILITGQANIEYVTKCMQFGAFDYIIKPVDKGRLITAIKHAIAFRELKRENKVLKQYYLTDSVKKSDELFSEIITNNKKMLSLFQYVKSISKSMQPVLITGETGTGKELIAKAIHGLSEVRGPFTPVNLAGLDDNIFSDKLFGCKREASMGSDSDENSNGMVEYAAEGTLFLDEIGDLSLSSQAKLLRLLQEGEYLPSGKNLCQKADVRIITSTNRNLWTLQRQGKFRKDLLYRLLTHQVQVPSLRERMDDLPFLIDHFLTQASRALSKKKPTPAKELITLLKTYTFPGNVRELKSMAFDAVTRHKYGVLSMNAFKTHIDRHLQQNDNSVKQVDMVCITFPKRLPTLKQSAGQLISEAMKRSNGNQSVASRLLGISQQALSKRLKNMSV